MLIFSLHEQILIWAKSIFEPFSGQVSTKSLSERLVIASRQAVNRRLSGSPHLIGSCQAVVRESSGSRQAVVRQSSGSHCKEQYRKGTLMSWEVSKQAPTTHNHAQRAHHEPQSQNKKMINHEASRTVLLYRVVCGILNLQKFWMVPNWSSSGK